MGRVSKHRKQKTFPKPKSHVVDKEIDAYADDMPKSLKRLLQKKKMVEEKGKKPQKRKKQQQQQQQSNPDLPVFEDVRPGESVIDFKKRIDDETKGHLTNQWKDTKRISQRKKNYYERRKEVIQHRQRNKKRKRVDSSDDEEEEEEEEEGKDEEEEEEEEKFQKHNAGRKRKRDPQRVRSFSKLKDEVSFGEVAEQPPVLNRKNKRRKVTHEDSERPTPETIQEKRKSMELLQKQVQERYRERKKKLQAERDAM